jgi:hypothetical protein
MKDDKNISIVIFFNSNLTDTHITKIRGTQYIVHSFFDGEENICDRVGELIESSFESSTVEEITGDSLLDSGIAIPDASRYNVRERTLYDY